MAGDVYPFSLLSPLAATPVVVTAMLAASVTHYLAERRRFDRLERL